MVKQHLRRWRMLWRVARYLWREEWLVCVIFYPTENPDYSAIGWLSVGVDKTWAEALAGEVSRAIARRESLRQGRPMESVKP